MTHAEFVKGWTLLIIQPWGRRYNAMEHGQPTQEAKAQLTFYYDKLKWAHADAWMEVADHAAQEGLWPCVSDLKTRLLEANRRFVRGLDDTRKARGVDMPIEVRALIARIGVGKDMPQDEQA